MSQRTLTNSHLIPFSGYRVVRSSGDPMETGGGPLNPNPTTKTRRLSEVSGGISAIFNPRKHRRNSAAVSQLSGEAGGSSGGRNPSVLVTDDDCDELNLQFPVRRAVTFERTPGGGVNGPMSVESSSGRRTGLSSAGSGTSASSVPLLADVQAQSSNAIVTLESSLIHQSSIDRSNHHRDSIHNNNNNNTHLKPIAKTFGTIRRAIFSKTARKVG